MISYIFLIPSFIFVQFVLSLVSSSDFFKAGLDLSQLFLALTLTSSPIKPSKLLLIEREKKKDFNSLCANNNRLTD